MSAGSAEPAGGEAWNSGDAYEQYVGRWSRKVATDFLGWLARPHDLAWADIGCGTGALTASVLARCEPRSVAGVDASERYVSQARRHIDDSRARFAIADATRLPWAAGALDVTVSGLVLNFVPDHDAMVREMVRVTKPGGTVAVYVWDYAGGMQMMRYFWDAAIAVSPADSRIDQAERFPVCQPEPLTALFERMGLTAVAVRAIAIPTVFRDFEDYWRPFLGRQGAAPAYLAAAGDETRQRIRSVLESRLASEHRGPIELTARAWAVRGVV